jgi:LacI family transcriptional regulator
MNSRVTAAQIAESLGLARSTVANVLNGRAEQLRISAATQARVHEAVRELGYRPNTFARGVCSGRFGSAALIQPLEGIYLPTGLLLGITDELQKNDMHLVVSEVRSSGLEDENYLPKVVREVAADGLLINMIGGIQDHLLQTLQTLNTPAIWINNKRSEDAVYPDDLHAGRWAAEHLVSQGHRHVAFLNHGKLDGDVHYSVLDRRQGYEDVMHEAGLVPRSIAVPGALHTLEEIHADERLPFLRNLLSSPNRPTAVVAYSDMVAIPLLQVAAELGLQLPRDLSLVMIADGPSVLIGRPVTAVCSNMASVGHEAVRLLLQKIETPSQPLVSYEVSPWFFGGDTTGPPP